ncbi:MAG TPA: oligosaccharide flippase family protein [Acidimicrobiales bacterium]|nr:oligosaccharide flippase family protein [Acidimicrobiales bacterium]
MARDAASVTAGHVSLLVVGAAASLLAARWLGPVGKGQLVVAYAVVALLGPVAAGGVDTYIAARGGIHGEAHRQGVVRFGLLAGWAGGAALAIGTVAYALASGLSLTLVLLAAAAAFLRPSVSVLQAIATSYDRVTLVGRVLVVMAGTQVAVLVVGALDGATLSDLASSTTLGVVVGYVLLVPVGWRAAGRAPALSSDDRREILRYGGRVVVADALQLASYRIDLFLLAALASVAEVGVYAVAVALVEILWQVPSALSRSLFPRVRAGHLDKARVVELSRRLLGGLVVLGGLGAVVTQLLVEPVLGSAYSAVPRLVLLLLPGVILVGAAKPLSAWTLSQGRPGRNLRASAAGFGVILIGDLLLIPAHGATGAAVSSSLSYAVTAIAVVLLAPPAARSEGPPQGEPDA